MYSRRWSFRTFSMGWLGLATMPLRLPPYADTTKAGSLPSSGLFDQRRQYYEPLGLPPSTVPLRHRLIGTAFARRGPPGRVSPVPYQAVLTCPPPYPVGVLHPFRLQDAVCCLRRGMSDSACPSPFGFLCHEAARFTFRLGPSTCFPLSDRMATKGLSTSRSDDPALADLPGPATRRSGAYRDGAFTR
jgi:hypothetical protein